MEGKNSRVFFAELENGPKLAVLDAELKLLLFF